MREDDPIEHVTPLSRASRGALTSAERANHMQAFLQAFRSSGNVAAACRSVGVSRVSVYAWRKEDETFAAQWAEAEEDAVDVLRAAAVRRGVHGWDVPVVSMGKMVMDQQGNPLMERKYSDPLLLALLKARAPEHRDQRHLELTGANGGPITSEQRVIFVLPQIDDAPPQLPFIDATPGTGSPLPERDLIPTNNLYNNAVVDAFIDAGEDDEEDSQ